MKKGFTLIEMLAVLILMSLVALLSAPAIINQITDKRNEISESTLDIIYSGAKLYFDDYNIVDSLEQNTEYCVSLDFLSQKGYIKSPIKDYKTGKEIPLTKYVKATVNSLKDLDNFELVDEDCTKKD